MKKIIFKTLKLKNFFSVGNELVVINFQKGLNIITGINKDLMDRQNGTGKSTIIDAFHFSLFGETTRDLKKEFVCNNITNEMSEVSLTFSIGDDQYEIYRTLKPSKCYLYHNEEDISRDSISNTTEYVLSLLKITPEVFSNCICLSVNSTVPFMAQKKIEKRKFIENVFNLNIFSEMNSFLKEDYSDVKKKLEYNREMYSQSENNLKILFEKNKKITEERLNRILNCEENIKEYSEEIIELNDFISKYNPSDSKNNEIKIQKLDDREKEKNASKDAKINEISRLKTTIDFLNKNLSKIGTQESKCPVCLKSLDEHDFEYIQEEKNKILKDIENSNKEISLEYTELQTLKKEIDLIVKAKNVLNQEINSDKLKEQKIVNDKNKIIALNKKISDQQKEIDSLKNLNVKENDDTELYEKKLQDIKNQIDALVSKMNILENVKFALSEEGIKSFVVNKMLKLFNGKISHYLKEMNSNITVQFDQYFEETIKNERNKSTMYFNYSGAERKAIDLAIMFAFIDILKMQTNINYNVQFYDELLDTSLDSSGVESVVKILNGFVDNENYGIYVISHRKECSKMSTGEVVFLEKDGGITKRVAIEV
jgi:hypothetical protein